MKSKAALATLLILYCGSANAMGKQEIDTSSFYESNPTYRDSVNDDSTWTFSTPAAVGLNEKNLIKAADSFGKKSKSFSMVVVKKNALVFERYFHGANKQASNNVHSASKSILSAAVGIAIAKGFIRSIDQNVTDFLPQAPRDLTLRHLLTMSSGIDWTEDSTEYQIEKEKDWVQAILRLRFPDRPGEKFLYSTGLTHLLSAVISKATGQSLAAFARANLFQKIGIADERWGADPQGISSGGYNLYLTPREMAKFGRLYVNGGVWNGQQVVPKAWVDESLKFQINARAGSDYGLLWWQRNMNGHAVKFAWGYGGQLIYIVPALELVVVFTTNTRGVDPNFEADALLKSYILPAARP